MTVIDLRIFIKHNLFTIKFDEVWWFVLDCFSFCGQLLTWWRTPASKLAQPVASMFSCFWTLSLSQLVKIGPLPLSYFVNSGTVAELTKLKSGIVSVNSALRSAELRKTWARKSHSSHSGLLLRLVLICFLGCKWLVLSRIPATKSAQLKTTAVISQIRSGWAWQKHTSSTGGVPKLSRISPKTLRRTSYLFYKVTGHNPNMFPHAILPFCSCCKMLTCSRDPVTKFAQYTCWKVVTV